MLVTILSIFYVLICLFLVMVVLLQQGKGGGMGSAFGGGGGSNTVFGGAGAGNFLTRLTAVAATLFMVLSALLAYLSTSGDRHGDAIDAAAQEEQADAVDTADGDGAGGTDEADDTPLTTEEAIEQEADDALDQLEGAFEDQDAIDEGVEGDPVVAPEPELEPEAEPQAPAPVPPAPAPVQRRPRRQPEATAPPDDEPPADEPPSE